MWIAGRCDIHDRSRSNSLNSVVGCRCVCVLRCWGLAVLGCWGVGVLGCWGDGVLGCWGCLGVEVGCRVCVFRI